MAQTFEVHGPFNVPVKKGKAGGALITKPEIAEFWECNDSMQDKVGCYVFGLQAGGGFKPMYVGKTTKSFKQECFSLHKLLKFADALINKLKGKPVMFFVVLQQKNKIVSKEAIASIDEVESYLIQAGFVANKGLLNDKKTSKPWSIKGIVRGGMGKPSIAANNLKQCLKL